MGLVRELVQEPVQGLVQPREEDREEARYSRQRAACPCLEPRDTTRTQQLLNNCSKTAQRKLKHTSHAAIPESGSKQRLSRKDSEDSGNSC